MARNPRTEVVPICVALLAIVVFAPAALASSSGSRRRLPTVLPSDVASLPHGRFRVGNRPLSQRLRRVGGLRAVRLGSIAAANGEAQSIVSEWRGPLYAAAGLQIEVGGYLKALKEAGVKRAGELPGIPGSTLLTTPPHSADFGSEFDYSFFRTGRCTVVELLVYDHQRPDVAAQLESAAQLLYKRARRACTSH
jgi:hypothetical protein